MLRIVRKRPLLIEATHYLVYKGPGHIDNVVVDHTGWEIRSQLRENKLRPGKKELVVVANLNATFPVPADGSVAIEHDQVFTRSLKTARDLWYDVVAWDPADPLLFYEIIPPTPAEIVDWPTDPYDNSSNDFIPGGGGHIYHTHPISQIVGLQSALNALDIWEGVTRAGINGDNELCLVSGGQEYWTPLFGPRAITLP